MEKEDACCIPKTYPDGYTCNCYYCSEQEYVDFFKQRALRDKSYQLCAEILDTHFNENLIRRMLDSVATVFDYNTIFNFLYDKQDYYYRKLKNKTFVSMYNEIMYLKAILLSELESYQKNLSQDTIKRTYDDIEEIQIIPTKRKEKRRRTIDELEAFC